MWTDDSAVSDTIGSILLVGITVASFVGLSALVLTIPAPPDQIHADLDIQVKPGPDRTWSTGDEYVQVRHLYGEPVPLAGTRFVVQINNDTYEYEGAALGFSDDRLDLGERWTVNLLVAFNDRVSTGIFNTNGGSGTVLATGSIITGKTECTVDNQAPAGIFIQSPDNVEAALGNNPVVIDVILTDACSAIDTGVDPVLDHWFGSEPSASALMTPNGTNRWTATVNAPIGGWITRSLQEFHYQVRGMTDLAGNVGDSNIVTDKVDPLPPNYYYVDFAIADLGGITEFAKMQNADDNGQSSQLTEAVNAGNVTNHRLYPDAESTELPFPTHHATWKNTDDVLGNTTAGAKYQHDNWPTNHPLRYEIQPLGITSGQVLQVTARVEAAVKPDLIADDGFRLQLCWTGEQITASTCSIKSPTLLATEDFTWMEYDFTNYRPGGGQWLPTDLDKVDILMEIVVVNGIRDGDYLVNRLELNATTGPGYDMTHRFLWQNHSILPSSNGLELRYRTSGGAFEVEVWDGSQYQVRGSVLNAAAPATWSTNLNSFEWNNGNPTIRINSLQTSPANQASLYIDYMRVTGT